MSGVDAPSRARQRLSTGDVLVSMTRPNLNAVAIVPAKLDGAIGSTGFHVLRSKHMVSQYLYFLVQSQEFVHAMCAVVQGALYPAVRPSDIGAFQMRIPSRAEQTRIVDKLEELLSDLDAGVADLKAAQKKLAQYRQSLLKAAVDGRLTEAWRAQHGEPEESGAQLLARILRERRARWDAKQLSKFETRGKAPLNEWRDRYQTPAVPDTASLRALPAGWVWASVEQLAELVSGHTPKDADASSVLNGAIPWFKVGDMNREGNEEWMVEAAVRFDPAAAQSIGMKIAPKGTIIFPKRGGAIATNKKRRLACASCYDLNTMGLVVVPLIEDWLWHWFMGIDLGSLSDGSNVPQINNPDIAPLLLPIPSAAEQVEILSLLTAGLEGIADQVKWIERSLKQSAAQRKNILQAAFSGQLVPQDPNDEPATALLERIRAERAASDRTRTGARRTRRTASAA